MTGYSTFISYKTFKRISDAMAALILLMMLWPLMVAVGMINVFAGLRPVLFLQMRIGQGQKKFTMYKFRSLPCPANRADFSLAAVPPNTWSSFLRKTHLDELPQLINILSGHMSFVGPRPLPVEYAGFFTREELQRHAVRPGVVGLAQLCAHTTWSERFQYDLLYVRNVSFSEDCRLLALFVKKILTNGSTLQPLPDLRIARQ